MDIGKIEKILQGTLDPNLRQQAEEELDNTRKIIGFAPSMLQLVMNEYTEMATRQSGVVYLKNMITQSWKDPDTSAGSEVPFSIHEQDRVLIRESIVEAIVLAPEMIRVQLAVCVYTMVKYDFPGRWPGIFDKISFFLQTPDATKWQGALIALYQVVKNFEYKKKESRAPLDQCMAHLFPILHHHMVALIPDNSEQSVLIQKIILKIFFSLTQFLLPLNLLTQPIFTQWMEVIRQIAERDVPEETNQRPEDERQELPWWKVKKWALHILARIFERYGCPSSVAKEYKEFAEWYIKSFSEGILQVIMKILNNYHNTTYVSPRVMQLSLTYIEHAIGQSSTWKLLKPHGMVIIQNVLFPLMCYTDYDEDLWKSDPAEYVRLKADIYEDLVSPVTAAQGVLLSTVKKRKAMLEKTMTFALQVLDTPNVDPKQKDGVFHMIGAMATTLLKKKGYKEKLEGLIARYVFPEFQSPFGFLRARACWIVQNFDEMKFEQEGTLKTAVDCLQGVFLAENDLPVKVEAAMALSALLQSHDKVEAFLEPNITQIVLELMKVIKETESDDLTNVMCKLVASFSEHLIPIAGGMCQELASTFQQIINEDGAEDKAITAMGLLSAIETLINCMEDNSECIQKIEPIALQVVGMILNKNVIDYYEEAFSLLYSLTMHHISAEAWQCYEMMYAVFKDDGYDYFTEMMPALHNFLCIDTDAFFSSEGRLPALLEIGKTILNTDATEEDQCHAAKLLECVILQCKDRIGHCLPQIIQVIVERLVGEVRTTELRTMLLQVIIASLYMSPEPVISILESMTLPNSNNPVVNHFIKQWVHDTDCFFGLHDRKICVLGLCTLLQLGPTRVPALGEFHKQILPSLVVLFQGLQKAYAVKALEENEEDSDDEDGDDEEYESDAENEVLSSDEDDAIELIQESIEDIDETGNDSDDEDDDEHNILLEDEMSETTLESYLTPIDKEDCEIDEYWIFKTVMQNLEQNVPAWYHALTEGLDSDQQTAILAVGTWADQRRAALQSKKIEESGGYSFQQQTVPSTFNFGG